MLNKLKSIKRKVRKGLRKGRPLGRFGGKNRENKEVWGQGCKIMSYSCINILLQVHPVGDTCQQKSDTKKICQMPEIQ